MLQKDSSLVTSFENMAATARKVGAEGLLKFVQGHLRNLSLMCKPKIIHTSCIIPATTFSVTRAVWGKTPTEIEEEKGVPEPPCMKIPCIRRDVRSGPRKLNLVARQIRGLPVELAIKQMEFSPKKAAITVKEVLKEGQDIAQKKYGVEDKSDLWVAESYVGKGRYLKRIRYHARGRFGIEHRKFSHYFLVLQEGSPKEKNVRRRLKHMTELEEIRRHPRRILNSLAWW